MTSSTASTALLASLLPRSARLATWSTNSDFVTLGLLLGELRGRDDAINGPGCEFARTPLGYGVLAGSGSAGAPSVRLSPPGADGCAVWLADRTRWHSAAVEGGQGRLDVRTDEALERVRAERGGDRMAP